MSVTTVDLKEMDRLSTAARANPSDHHANRIIATEHFFTVVQRLIELEQQAAPVKTVVDENQQELDHEVA